MRKTILVAVLAMCPFALFGAHHRITLNDGNSFEGVFVSGTSRQIVFQDQQGVRRRFDVNNVRSLELGPGDGQISSSRSDTAYNDNYGTAARSDQGRSAAAMIPAGSEIAVRTNEKIDSNSAAEGRTYAAEVYKDVMDANGAVLIPRGSDASLVVRRVNESGTTSGETLVLDLQSVMLNGRRYLVSTEDVTKGREGIGKNRRTAEMVGGGAALGTLLGAIAGGGKGAVIGAIAGAAAGGAAQVLTKGKEVKVPAETVLTFKLDQPVRLQQQFR